MTIHVNIGEAKTRLSELVAAALRGEEVIVQRDGQPKVRLVPLPEAEELDREARAAKRRAAFGFLADKYRHLHGTPALDVPPSMTDEEYEERIERKFGKP
ncbi:MAG: type II toxin-antitoxin system prevent-host-death family antitoxin [Sphingopyxis sp.]|uniref:type II toxin-antitoxin system Phd/YefM family antitoxin n=1 Tax=Sphingopyxis sp. TaxID=1908224 RepID=UPI003D80E029